MSDTTETLNRRGFIGAAGSLAGGIAGGVMAAGAAQAATPSYDYKKAVESFRFKDNIWNRDAYAKLQANLDVTKIKYGWFGGVVLGVRPNEKVRELFRFEGMSTCRFEKRADGSYMKLLREVGYYRDFKTGEFLTEWQNPYTNEKVKVVPITNDPFNYAISEFYPDPPSFGGLNQEKPPKIPFILKWTPVGKTLLLETDIHLYYPNALQPDKWPRESAGKMVQASEMYRYNIRIEDMADASKTSVEYTGTWARVTPWLPWMLMGQAEGHCTYECYMGGFDSIDSIPADIVEYTKKNYSKFLTPPDKDTGRSLSSLEVYAETQKPAPAKQPGT
ncbi:MAG: DUF1838 family protein [Rhodospirillaceae bacterium]|nr:DUF1838 family protein [Rhodospirillaceae bacterium]